MDELVEGLKQRIEEARLARGMGRGALADAIGAPRSTVTEWYTQGKMPAASHVVRLPEALGVTPEWLLTGTGPRERPVSGVDGYAAAWSEAAQELRAMADRFEERAGKRTGPSETPGPGTGEATGGEPNRLGGVVDRSVAGVKQRQGGQQSG